MVGSSGAVSDVDFCRLSMDVLERLGIDQVTRSLGVTAEEFRLMVLGEMEISDSVKSGIMRMEGVLESGNEYLDGDDDDEVIEYASVPSVTDEELALLPDPRVGSGGTSTGVMDRLKADLYAARLIATRNLMDLRLRDDEILSNQLVVLEIELTIILHFGDSVPTPGLNWTNLQLSEESEKRLRRLRWVNTALVKHDRGVKGIFRRFVHGKRRTPREMLNDMMRDADTLHKLGRGEVKESREDLLKRVLEPTGLDSDLLRDAVGGGR